MSQTLEALVVELRADVKGLQTSLQAAAGDVARFSDRASSNVSGFEAAILRARTAVLSLGVAWAAFRIGRGIVDAGMQVEAMRNRMVAATGDAVVAGDALAYVRREADRLGLDIQTATNGFAGFAASSLRAGLTLQQTKDIFTGVSEAAVSMRLPAEQASLVFKALEQIAGKGTVSMEELRGQLGDALPGAFEIAAKAMGKSTSEFAKMVANGEVLAGDFLPRFGEAIRRELGGSVDEAAQGAQAAFNRLGNAFFDLQTRLASSGLLDVVVKAVNDLTAALNDPDLVAGLGSMISMLAKIAEFALKTAAAIGNVISGVKNLIRSAGDGIFGTLFGEEGAKAIQQARQQSAEVAKVAAPAAKASASYALGTVATPDVSSAQQKASEQAERLRERLRSQVETMNLGNTRETDPARAASMELMKQQETLEEALKVKAITEREFREANIQAELAYQEQLAEIRQRAWEDEQSALEGFLGVRFKSEQEMREASIQDQATSFARSISEAAKHNRIFFQLEKARAIAAALISARESVVHAYNFGARIGGPPLGAAFAGVAAAAQAANIAAIASTSYNAGGSVGSAGSGGSGLPSNGADDASAPSAGPERSVYITLHGDESMLFGKNQIRRLIASINDALGDGSQLKVAVSG